MDRYPDDRSFVRAATDAVRLSDHVVVEMKDFPAADRMPASYCQARVRECDVYIGVIGFRYGSPVVGGLHAGGGLEPVELEAPPAPDAPPGVPVEPARQTTVSYTELEFITATESKIPRLLFLLEEDTPIPRRFIDQNPDAVEAFRARLRSADVIVGTFRNADELDARITRALLHVERELRERADPRPRLDEPPPMVPAPPPVPFPKPDDQVRPESEEPGSPPDTVWGRRRRRRRYVVGAVVVACAVAAGAVLGAGVWRPGSSPTCQPPAPLTRLPAAETWVGSDDGQCIGFSDGSYAFDTASPDLTSLLSTIARQNAALAGRGPVYTVVVAAPLTGVHAPAGGGQGDSPTTVGQGGLNELLGAQLAQAAINAAADAPGSRSRTRIRLLVANVGWQSNDAPTLARRIDAAARADPSLAGVLGLFQSTTAAKQAVATLSGTTHLPIVSSTASDDGFTRPVGPPGHTRRQFDWYFRVGPTNRREAAVIAQAVPGILADQGRGGAPIRPLIVFAGGVTDPRTENADHYSDNLAQDVSAELRRLPHAVPAVVVPFPTAEQAAATGTADGGPTVLGALGRALSLRCSGPTPPNLLVYTGRTTSVNILLEALAGSACGKADPHMPIISGDDAMELETDPGEIAAGATGSHAFYFADFGLAQPGDVPPSYLARTRPGSAVPGQWADRMRSTPQRLISGHTIVAFDAMSVLTRAISATELNTPPPGQLRANVKTVLDGFCGNSALPGANGYISFDRYGDSTSAPVVIRRFDPTDATVTIAAPGTAPDSLRPPTTATSDCTVL